GGGKACRGAAGGRRIERGGWTAGTHIARRDGRRARPPPGDPFMAAACSHTGVARTRLPAVALLALAALLGAGPPAKRQDPRDLQLTIYARRALLGDKDLAPLNLSPRGGGGVATLPGPLPSRETAEHAVAVVKKVEGIREARNALSVVPPRTEQALGSLRAGGGPLPGAPSGPAAGLDD